MTCVLISDWFLKGAMNIIDALAIAPYYIDLFFMPPPNFDIPENPDEVYCF